MEHLYYGGKIRIDKAEDCAHIRERHEFELGNCISYDKKVYTVKVTVTNNGDGTMTATADTDRDDIKFVNSTHGRTGDDMNASLWIMLLVMAGGALGAVMYLRRKKVLD